MSEEQRLEEQLLSQVVESKLSDQLDQAEKIDVDVQTDLLKVVQGQVDGVSIKGQGLVMKNDIRVQELKLQTESVAINPLSALFGQIELNHPVNASARIVLTEADINRTFKSDYIRNKMEKFDLNVDGEIVSLETQQTQIYLPGSGKMKFNGTMLLHEKGNTRSVGFSAIFRPPTPSEPVMLESFNCIEGDGFSLEVVAALMQQLKALVNQPCFELEDMIVRVKNIEVLEGSLVLLIETRVKQIPSA